MAVTDSWPHIMLVLFIVCLSSTYLPSGSFRVVPTVMPSLPMNNDLSVEKHRRSEKPTESAISSLKKVVWPCTVDHLSGKAVGSLRLTDFDTVLVGGIRSSRQAACGHTPVK